MASYKWPTRTHETRMFKVLTHRGRVRHICSSKFIVEVQLAFEMLTVRRQQHSFSTHERMFLGKCQSFWDRKCLYLSGTRTPNLRIHVGCSSHLSYQGQTFAVPCCWILVLASVKLVVIGSNDLLTARLLLIEPLGTNFRENCIKPQMF